MSDNQVWEEPFKVEQYRHWVNFEEMKIPVLSLEYEHQAYLKLGRIVKAEKI
ncbi:MAG: nucleotidyltransferase domain-containing protein [Anaerolineales bacterium]